MGVVFRVSCKLRVSCWMVGEVDVVSVLDRVWGFGGLAFEG